MTGFLRERSVRSMLRALRFFTAGAGPALVGCSSTPITVDLRSLQASGNVTFVCRGDDNPASGHELRECPDYEAGTRRLIGLVTQTATDEVALVDLYAQSVVDVDPATPGYSFLRLAARPGAIVTTPGGAASFVGITGLQKNGVVALPSTCLGAPTKGQTARDLTTWSACALSSAPGDISILVDEQRAGREQIRGACDGGAENVASQDDRECPADLTRESGPTGRRKLIVALPEEHKLVLLDAQRLLDRHPGEFAPCEVEATVNLEARLPSEPLKVKYPADLEPVDDDPDTCVVSQYPPLSSSGCTPGGFALSGDTLYVADRTVPVVHVVDVSDPCAATERAPLLPRSFLSPARVVTTSRVAVSPVTPRGEQFLYAVDDSDQPASVMAFDVSALAGEGPNSSRRTPMIFDGAPRQPYLPPDRVRFSAPVRDVLFVSRDFPESDPMTSVGQFGTSCDPNPGTSSVGSKYRPNSDFTDGARPPNLRGIFAMAMLTNGQVAVVDVDDFDAPCRRPIFPNASSTEDFRGCRADPVPKDASGAQPREPFFYTVDGKPESLPTVTNESSCRVVEPHRPRSAVLSLSNATVGLRAPTLRSFPQFSNPDPAAATGVSEQPHLRAVDFAAPGGADAAPLPAQVNVSAQTYVNCPLDPVTQKPVVGDPPCDGSAEVLDIRPSASQNSLVLPLVEPRSYALDESPTLTFEGRVFPDRTSGFLQLSADVKTKPKPSSKLAFLQDPDANFCAAGVEDSDSITAQGKSLGIASARLATWAKTHADYLQISGDFPAAEDVYWSEKGAGRACTRDACVAEFGNIDNPAALLASRDLTIEQAFSDHLVVTPRCQNQDGTRDGACDPAHVLRDLRCCFPAGTAYTVRASHQWLLGAAAGLHDLAASASGRCVHTASCDRRKEYFHSRVFEVCEEGASSVACADDDNVACVLPADARGDAANVAVEPGGAGAACIFENLTARFVVYRGAQPSTRGMAFNWQTTGGFVPQSLSLATQSSQVNPQSMTYLSEVGYLAVVDGSTLGLSLFDLNSLGIVLPSPYF